MGRRNRQHTVKLSWIEDNSLKNDIILAENLHEALHIARENSSKSVQIFDILGIEIHLHNKHILDFVPEEIDIIEEIIEEPIEETLQPVEISEEIIETTEEIKVEEKVETPKKKSATKKPATKKTTTKKISQ